MKIERDGEFLYGIENRICYCVYRGIDGKMQYSAFSYEKEHYIKITPDMLDKFDTLENMY